MVIEAVCLGNLIFNDYAWMTKTDSNHKFLKSNTLNNERQTSLKFHFSLPKQKSKL